MKAPLRTVILQNIKNPVKKRDRIAHETVIHKNHDVIKFEGNKLKSESEAQQ